MNDYKRYWDLDDEYVRRKLALLEEDMKAYRETEYTDEEQKRSDLQDILDSMYSLYRFAGR
jgi:hypothetical protein